MNIRKLIAAAITIVMSTAICAKAQKPVAVDLGLSVEWATTNLDATSPEDFGGYYGWADPTGVETTMDVLDKSRNWVSGLYGGPEPPAEISGTELDIVHVSLGDGWRMPTLDELRELTACQHKWTKLNGVNGYEFTGKNGNKLFLPAGGARNGETVRYAGTVGYYWTGTLETDPSMHKQRAHRLYIGAEGINLNPAIRYSGYSIRAVRDKNYSGLNGIASDEKSSDNEIYDLTGRKLNSKPEKGFYIQNGKKYIVKSYD